MIHLSAFVNNDPLEPISEELSKKWANYNIFPKLINRWTYAQGNVFIFTQADCAISQYVYSSHRMVLICHTDLLGSGTCDDFREASQNPARYLARLYEQKGDDFVRNLHGWFGIVLYDFEQNALKAWTDHFGVRRIVYKSTPASLAIASDLRLLNGFFAQSPQIDPQAILEYLQYTCIPAPRTIYKDTFRLEPGHWLVSCPTVACHTYWDMKYDEIEGRSLKDWASKTFEEIESAVARSAKTLDDTQNLGCFLSGGTDSSSVSGLVGSITGKPPKTFSIGFDDPRYNEIEYARIAARHFQTDHLEYFIGPQDIIDLLQNVNAVFDEPFGNSSIIPAYYCARLAADNGVKHMLAGDGGDELFGGNQRYADDRLFQPYNGIPGWVRRRFIEPVFERTPLGNRSLVFSRIANYVRRCRIPVPDRWHSYEFLSSTTLAEVFSTEFLVSIGGCDPLQPSRKHYASAKARNELNRWLYLDLKVTINDNDLRKVTSMCEMAGVIPRYPLLDPALAEFSGTIPTELKVRRRKLRYLFKIAMASLLPQQIIEKKKHGFGLPFSVWLGSDKALQAYTFDILNSRQCQQRAYFRRDLIPRLWSQYQNIHQNFYGSVLWLFLILELWHQASQNAANSDLEGFRFKQQ
jgi:asparagine synthase (glutamine-hydrolysing)